MVARRPSKRYMHESDSKIRTPDSTGRMPCTGGKCRQMTAEILHVQTRRSTQQAGAPVSTRTHRANESMFLYKQSIAIRPATHTASLLFLNRVLCSSRGLGIAGWGICFGPRGASSVPLGQRRMKNLAVPSTASIASSIGLVIVTIIT